MDTFEYAAGSIAGKAHFHPTKRSNNQDYYLIRVNKDLVIIVVCDGCSSSPHSEVGANLGANIVASSMESIFDSQLEQRLLHDYYHNTLSEAPYLPFLEGLEEGVLGKVASIASYLGGDFESQVLNCF